MGERKDAEKREGKRHQGGDSGEGKVKLQGYAGKKSAEGEEEGGSVF